MIHGQKKTQKHKSEQQLKQQNKLSQKISSKLSEFFEIRNQPINPQKLPQLLQFTNILMQLCNDIATVFNYRRQLIEMVLIRKQDEASRAKILGGDLKLVSKIMMDDPKSYTLWSYRQWLILKLYSIDKSILQKQKQLCKAMLMKDQKNFHVWNYRNWVNSVNLSLQSQLEFTKSKINSNPFNFSPYHFRSKLLMKKYDIEIKVCQQTQRNQIIKYGMPKKILDQQLEMVKTAIFLNPKQQAPWLYYSWLLKQLLPTILLKIQPNTNDKTQFTLIFSQKIENPVKLIKSGQNDQNIKVRSNNTSSNCWLLTIQNKQTHLQDILISSSSQSFKTETTCRRILGNQSTKQDIQEINQIYQSQVQFIKEVIEAQQNICRFGWLQLLEVYNNQLYLGTTAEKWQQIIKQALNIFEQLLKETKGLKYIQKQHQYWQNLQQPDKLTQIQKILKNKWE